MAKSLPEDLRKALVHLVLRGFFFFLNAFLHLDRQNLKIYKINEIDILKLRTNLELLPCSHFAQIPFHGRAKYLTNKNNIFLYAF